MLLLFGPVALMCLAGGLVIPCMYFKLAKKEEAQISWMPSWMQ